MNYNFFLVLDLNDCMLFRLSCNRFDVWLLVLGVSLELMGHEESVSVDTMFNMLRSHHNFMTFILSNRSVTIDSY